PTNVTPYPSMALGACELSLYEMLGSYTMFPAEGINTEPYYITRIEDKHGNVVASFISEHKEVLSQQTAYTMTRMMQGTTDFGTAHGLRQRLGLAEMGGKTGTTNDNSDCWFMGYTPQLLAGAWVGCDERFIHLDGGSADGGHIARPIWENFFARALADKSLGLDRNARFPKPDSISTNLQYNYENQYQKAPPAGIDSAAQYFDTTANKTNQY
ncbi:MAG TPA: penicillin-binding transpeptidase domain-containing protein, partial [Puia sp.]|nr:penicillin-binding transpeptidase domain-containing protein [Puia sp.]